MMEFLTSDLAFWLLYGFALSLGFVQAAIVFLIYRPKKILRHSHRSNQVEPCRYRSGYDSPWGFIPMEKAQEFLAAKAAERVCE